METGIHAIVYYRDGTNESHELSSIKDIAKNGAAFLYNFNREDKRTCTVIPLDLIQRIELVKGVDLTED